MEGCLMQKSTNEDVENFYQQPRVMNYYDLKEANDYAIENNFNRSINLDKFTNTVTKFGYNYKDLSYPVMPLVIHEHAQGKKVEPHVRVKIVGPFDDDTGLVVQAILDCSFSVFNRIPVFDMEKRKLISMN